jgi:hypothetical protein
VGGKAREGEERRDRLTVESVAGAFASYRAQVLPPEASAVQVLECQRAFYAGAYFLLMNIAHNIGDDSTPEEDGIEQLEALKTECEAFGAAGGLPLPVAVPGVIVRTATDAEQRAAILRGFKRHRTDDLFALLNSKHQADGDIETFVNTLVDEVAALCADPEAPPAIVDEAAPLTPQILAELERLAMVRRAAAAAGVPLEPPMMAAQRNRLPARRRPTSTTKRPRPWSPTCAPSSSASATRSATTCRRGGASRCSCFRLAKAATRSTSRTRTAATC